MIHFGERECSIQRRHQKVVEECPSPLMAARPGMREAMGAAAIRVALRAGYSNAGTVEFLVDAGGDFYFLEMNTRLQVEHPVTELVTGHDLVRLQLEVAAGEPLRLRQEEVSWRGSSIECRIYAEDPDNHFFPSPGRITRLTCPLGPGVRLDGCVYDGWTVPMEYDPLLAKLAVWSETREDAIARMRRALREYDVGGIHTNIAFFRQLLEDVEFRGAELHTGFLDEFLQRRPPSTAAPELESVAALVAAFHWAAAARAPEGRPPASRWLQTGRGEALQ
jgi:acetyl-CoA carboxylase biotin carboxylase subunit